jgi:hypothetical protein
MSKGLRSYPEGMRLSVAMRRTQRPKEKGNGYWAAVAFLAHAGIPIPQDKGLKADLILIAGQIIKTRKATAK